MGRSRIHGRCRRGSIIPASAPSTATSGQRPGFYVGATDTEALEAFALLARSEGIVRRSKARMRWLMRSR